MNNLLNPLIDDTVQCWGCPIFDRLFQVVSSAAGAVYSKTAAFCVILFCVLFSFFVINAVWKNIKNEKGNDDTPFYMKSIKPVFINSLIAIALLSMGVFVPRMITTVTFEPVASITATYTQSMLQIDESKVNTQVTYQPTQMSEDGFYRPALRDNIILIMKTTITQFQSYIKLGVAVMDSAFTWDALLGISAFMKHIILFFIGLYLFYAFIKLFVRFCFYFVDVIVAMTFFGFLFPFSIVLIPFQNTNAPKWLTGLGKNLGPKLFKKVINAIVGLAAAVITYTVMIVILAKFFTANGASTADLMELITNGDVFEADLDQDNLAQMTMGATIILVYVLNFIYSQIPQAKQMILNAFDVEADTSLGDQLADQVGKLGTLAKNATTKAIGIIANGGKPDKEKTPDDKSGKPASGDKKDNKTDKQK